MAALSVEAQRQASWQSIAKQAQDHRDVSLAQVRPPLPPDAPDKEKSKQPRNVTGIPRQFLNASEISITETAPEALLEALATGRLSSVDVTNAFLRRAVIAQRLANCVTEVFPGPALERAKQLDDYLHEYKRPIGPLHGLPISIKSHIALAGHHTPCSFASWWDKIPKRSAHVLNILENAGAVFYVRSTEPQCLMHLETSSNLYGETVNPYGTTLTCGGSSGGEGTLLGLRASCIGIGTDIGGSIRSPAANCGVWGYRPTANRIPTSGAEAPMKGYDSIMPVLGPLATSFEGLCIWVDVVLKAKPWLEDPLLLNLEWRYPLKEGYSWFGTSGTKRRKIKLGVLWHDDIVRPHPPLTKALTKLVRRIESTSNSGGGIDSDTDIDIDVVNFTPYKHDEAWSIVSSLYFPDGAKEELELMARTGEPQRPLTEWLLGQEGVKDYTVSELWRLNVRRDSYKVEYAAHWNKTVSSDENVEQTHSIDNQDQEQDKRPIDLLLSPVGPGVAPPLNHAKYWNYTSQWNLLDYPAVVFPFGQVRDFAPTSDKNSKDNNNDDDGDGDDDYEKDTYIPLTHQDEENRKIWFDHGKWDGDFQDAPVGLQLIARRLEDEKLFEGMEIIKRIVGV